MTTIIKDSDGNSESINSRSYIIAETVADGETDNYAVLAAAIATGKNVYVGEGTICVSQTLFLQTSNQKLFGAGPRIYYDAGITTGRYTSIKATEGFTGDCVIEVSTPSGSEEEKQVAINLDNLDIDANGQCEYAKRVRTVNFCNFTNLSIGNATGTHWLWGVQAECKNARDPQHNFSNNVMVYSESSLTAADDANGIALTGEYFPLEPGGANTSINFFGHIWVKTNNGVPMQFFNCDNNTFQMLSPNRTTDGNIVEFHGYTGTDQRPARSNVIMKMGAPTTAKPIYAYGTDTYDNPSYDNTVMNIDIDNGGIFPVVETGASCYATKTNGQSNYSKSIGQELNAETVAAMVDLVSRGLSHSSQILNYSGQHLALIDGTTEWSLDVSAGNLRIRKISGTGQIQLPATTDLTIGGNQVSAGANDSGGTGYRMLLLENT